MKSINKRNLSSILQLIDKNIDSSLLLNKPRQKKEIRKYYLFNRLAYLYFHNWQGFMHMGISDNDMFQYSDLLKHLSIIEGYIKPDTKQILELGCGNGSNSIFLAKRHKNIRFYGIDLTTKNFLLSVKPNNYSQQLGDYHDLSQFKNESFDLVFVIEALCHSNNKQKVLEEVYTKLKPNGIFIIIDGYIKKELDTMTKEEKVAEKIATRSMAVNDFESIQNFRKIISNTRFTLLEERDYSKKILPSLYRFEKIAYRYLRNDLLAKAVRKLMPLTVKQNAVAALLLPWLVEHNIAGYYIHTLQKSA